MFDFDDMKQAYLRYRTIRYMMEHPEVQPSRARKYARVAWRQKMQRWQKKGLLITKLSDHAFTNADPKKLPKWTKTTNADGTESFHVNFPRRMGRPEIRK